MPHVYVLNKGPHDYRDAERFGTLVFCSDGPVDKLDISQMYRILSTAMKGSNPEDYILITSLASLCAVAAALAAHKHGELHLLVFHEGEYLPKSIYLEQHITTEELLDNSLQ